MNIRTHLNFKLELKDMESPWGVSCTVPDETLSVRDIMDRFVRGQRIPDNLFRNGVFDDASDFDSDDVEKLRHADFAEQDEVIARLKAGDAVKKKLLDADQKRLKVISRQEMKDKKVLSSLILEKKNKRKGAAGPGRSRDAKRPSKGADEGSE